MALTEKGVGQKDDVIRLIFALLNRMKEGMGPLKYIHEERRQMSEISFQFQPRSGARGYSKRKASALS